MVGTGIVKQAQDKVRLDLNSARLIYTQALTNVREVIRHMAVRFFLRDALSDNDMDKATSEWRRVRINELIDYVKMSTGEWRLKHQPIKLRRFLSEVARIYEADAPVFPRKFECWIELAEDLELPGDLGLFTRAFDNLFHNALRYTDHGDAIRLVGRQENGDVVIMSADNGRGVTKE